MKLYEKNGMRKYCPGWTSGLKVMSLMMMAFAFMTFASTAQAQFHGATIQKQCTTDVRNCVDNTDCTNDDDNACTPEFCNTDTAPRTTNCNIRATNTDEFGDSVTVSAAFEEILTAVGIIREPLVGSLIVSAVGGSTDCVAGDPLPCKLNVAGSYVQFNVQYTLLEADSDLAAIIDQGTVTWNDNCELGSSCSEQDNTVQAPAGSAVLDACETLDERDCDDSNVCTADSCDPATGECVNVPTDCDDSNACTDDSCDPVTGDCVNTDNINCDDSDVCTADSCDPVTGACVNAPTDCDDSDACTADSCDPATGECVSDPTDCDDSDACTADSCDPVTGECVNVPTDCDDLNECTDDSCDPITGECVSVENESLSCEPIPTLSVGGLVAMILTLLGLGGILIRRRSLRKAA